jgi:T5orf172 domain
MIYLIAAREPSMCKIGTARDVKSRFNALQTASPFELSLIATREGNHVLERQIHASVREWHVRGEWFRFVPEVVQTFHDAVLGLVVRTGRPARCVNETVAIIDALGGTAQVAKALNSSYTTVASWREKNRIPYWRHDVLIELGEGRIQASDFPPSVARVSRSAAA